MKEEVMDLWRRQGMEGGGPVRGGGVGITYIQYSCIKLSKKIKLKFEIKRKRGRGDRECNS